MYTSKITISSGNIDADTIFTYGKDTEVFASCAATLHNEFWVIGGYNKQRQVSIKLSKYISNIFSVEQSWKLQIDQGR